MAPGARRGLRPQAYAGLARRRLRRPGEGRGVAGQGARHRGRQLWVAQQEAPGPHGLSHAHRAEVPQEAPRVDRLRRCGCLLGLRVPSAGQPGRHREDTAGSGGAYEGFGRSRPPLRWSEDAGHPADRHACGFAAPRRHARQPHALQHAWLVLLRGQGRQPAQGLRAPSRPRPVRGDPRARGRGLDGGAEGRGRRKAAPANAPGHGQRAAAAQIHEQRRRAAGCAAVRRVLRGSGGGRGAPGPHELRRRRGLGGRRGRAALARAAGLHGMQDPHPLPPQDGRGAGAGAPEGRGRAAPCPPNALAARTPAAHAGGQGPQLRVAGGREA
mmetsp:Transcript_136767/g.381215  ORF Transcript_136767/g.381215 Transcript_136767/m.381215 type:complete len:327 (-) Transcript_136767:70-1050(-)